MHTHLKKVKALSLRITEDIPATNSDVEGIVERHVTTKAVSLMMVLLHLVRNLQQQGKVSMKLVILKRA